MCSKVLLVFVLATVVATSAFAGEKCTADTQACLNMLAAEQDYKGWLGIEKDKAADGYTISRVVAGSPAEKAGFKVGDMLVAVNSMKIGSDDLKENYAKVSKAGANVTYTVARNGKNMELNATLVKMPEELFAQMVGMHMLEHATVQSAAK